VGPFRPAFVPNASACSRLHHAGRLRHPVPPVALGDHVQPDKVEEPKSWTDLWNPKYKGRVSMWDVYYDAYIMAGVVTGKGPDIEAGIKAWAPHKENIGAWVNSPTAEEDLVSRGEMWLAPHWAPGPRWPNRRARMSPSQFRRRRRAMDGHMRSARLLAEGKRVSSAISTSVTCQSPWASAASTRCHAAVKVPEALKSNPAIVTSEDALAKLLSRLRQNGREMPRLKSMIDRTQVLMAASDEHVYGDAAG
jgi:hypothetical protein